MAGDAPESAKIVRRLGPGVFAVGEELHVDLEALILSAGGNPRSERDQDTAMRAVIQMCEEQGIELGMVDAD